MITFKQFILEDENHTLEEAVDVFKKHCSDWTVTSRLYRISGSTKEKSGGIRTRETRERLKRSAAYTADLQDWIFSTPALAGFPDRSKSIFCSTTRNFSIGDEQYRHLYCIIPFNNTKLAVTEAKDFNLIEIADTFLIDLKDDLQNELDRRIEASIIEVWEAVVEHLSGLPPKSLDDQQRAFLELPKYFTPAKLGLHIETPKSFSATWFDNTHEVWFEGKYLSIPHVYYDDFISLVKQT